MSIHLTVQQWLNKGGDDFFLPFSPTGNIVCGLVRYDAEKDLFSIYTQANMVTYDIEAERILTSAAFTDWLWQLHHTDWFTGQHAKDFLDCLCCYIYREHNGQFPQPFYEVTNAINRGPDGV